MKKIGLVGIIVLTAAFVMLVIGCATQVETQVATQAATQVDINKLPSEPVNERLEGAWQLKTMVLRLHENRVSLTDRGSVMEGVVKQCANDTIILTFLTSDRKNFGDLAFRYKVKYDGEDQFLELTSFTNQIVEMSMAGEYLKITE